MSCIRSCFDKDSHNFGHDECSTCIHKDGYKPPPVAITNHGNAEDQYIAMSKHLNCPHCGGSGHVDDVIVQEPVVLPPGSEFTPTQRKPLTDEQIGDIAALFYPRWQGHEGFARAIEAAHGIKGKP